VTKVRHPDRTGNQPFPRAAGLASRLQYTLAMNRNRLALAAVVTSCFSFGALGCSTTTASTPVHAPSLAFAASVSDVTQSCTPEGMPRVVASHVVPTAGVTAVAEGGRIGLRFATTKHPRLATTLDPESLEVVEGETPVTAARPGAQGPVDVELPDHRHLVAWTEGTLESGLRVRVRTVGADGMSDAPIDLGYEGSAIGQPAIAVTRSGSGVIAFIESNGAGFQVVAVRMTCAIP
jgi:hypothetical protein